MSKQLPERADLGQLKKQAKDLLKEIRAGAPEAMARIGNENAATFGLVDAQRVLAREYGFASWARLKLHVETREIGLATARLVIAAASGDRATLDALLAERPALARQTVSACAVLGDFDGLHAWVAKNAEFARAQGGVCETEALAYVCLGRLGGDEAARVACADLLLAQGANPNATWREDLGSDLRLPALYAATGRNNYPMLARRLLAAGANPNDGESIYHAAESFHPECLSVLQEAGGDLSGRDVKWGNTPLYFLLGWSPDAAKASTARAGILWLLDRGADPNVPAAQIVETPLFPAVRNGWDDELIRKFLDCGASVNARRADGRSIFATAVRAGRMSVAELLRERGAFADAADEDRFLGALATASAERARAELSMHPEWREGLAGEITERLVGAARRGEAPVLVLAVQLGLAFDRPTGPEGGRPLHWAAWHGRVDAVKQLIAAGASLDGPDGNFHAPPLGWCCHGSRACAAVGGDYGGVAEALLAAGATPMQNDGATPDVVAVLRRYAPKRN